MNLHTALVKIKTEGPVSPGFGICANLYDLGVEPVVIDHSFNEQLEPYYSKWRKYSGNSAVPIPGKFSAYQQYMGTPAMWDRKHPYGKLRWELLEHLIKETSI